MFSIFHKTAAQYHSDGNTKCTLDRYQEAIEDYTQAIRLNPNNAEYYHSRGIAEYKIERYQEVIEDFTQAIQLSPNNAIYYYNRGLAKSKLDRYQEAIKDYTEAIRLNPKYASCYYNRASAECKLERYQKALADYKQALKLTRNFDILTNIGFVLNKLDRHKEALAEFNHSLELRPNHAKTLTDRGDTYRYMGQYEEALRDYTRSLKLNSHDSYTLYQRGFILEKLNRGEEAIAELEHSYKEALVELEQHLKYHPNDVSALIYHSDILSSLGRYEEALVDCNRAVELEPNNLEAIESRRLIFDKLGRDTEASADRDRFLALKPNDTSAPLDREKILQAIAHSKRNEQKPKGFSFFSIDLGLFSLYIQVKEILNYAFQYLPKWSQWRRNDVGKNANDVVNHQPSYLTSTLVEDSVLPEHPYSFDKNHIAGESMVLQSHSLILEERRETLSTQSETVTLVNALPESGNNLQDSSLIQPGSSIASAGVVKEAPLLQTGREEALNKQLLAQAEQIARLQLESQQNDALKKELELQKKKFQRESQRANQLEKLLEKQRQKTSALESSFFEKSEYITTPSQQIRLLEQKIGILQKQIQQNDTLKRELELEKKRLQQESQKNIQLETSLQEHRAKITHLEAILSKKSEQESTIREGLEQQSRQLKQATKRSVKLENELSARKQEIVRLESAIAEQSQHGLGFTLEIEQLQAKIETLEKASKQQSSLKEALEHQMQRIHYLEREIVAVRHASSWLPMQSQSTRGLRNQTRSQTHYLGYLGESPLTQGQAQSMKTVGLTRPVMEPLGSSTMPLDSRAFYSVIVEAPCYVRLPEALIKLLHSFTEAGYYALIVSGAVRDLLVGKNFPDVDIITNMPSTVILANFKPYFIQATPQVSGLYQMTYEGLKIDLMCYATDIFTSKEALLRDAQTRIFTINALYCDSQGRVYDPLSVALTDLLSQPALRLISDDISWFERDPILLLRASRLATNYDLKIDLPIKELIRNCSPLIKSLDSTRLHIELKRHFLRGQAVKNLEYLKELNLLESLYPRTALFLKSSAGEQYQKWLSHELYQTDQLAITQNRASMKYVYALLLVGSVLQGLGQVEKNPSNVKRVIDEVISEASQSSLSDEYLERIKEILVGGVDRCLAVAYTQHSLSKSETTRPIEPQPFLIQFQANSQKKLVSIKRSRSCPELCSVEREAEISKTLGNMS